MSVDTPLLTRSQQSVQQRAAAKFKSQLDAFARRFLAQMRAYGEDHGWSDSYHEQAVDYCRYLLKPAVSQPTEPKVEYAVRVRARKVFSAMDRRCLPHAYTVGQRTILYEEPAPRKR